MSPNKSGAISPYILPCVDDCPTSPTHLFHHMGVSCPPVSEPAPSLEFASAAVAAVVAHKVKSKLRGVITGMPSHLDVSTDGTDMIRVEKDGDGTVIYVNPVEFVPGSCVLYKTGVEGEGVGELRRLIGIEKDALAYSLIDRLALEHVEASVCWFNEGKNGFAWPPGLREAVDELGDVELNVALFRCSAEDKDFTNGINSLYSFSGLYGSYSVPNFGELAYCGLQGFVSALAPIARGNDLAHPVCANLREGPWMMDYITGRLDFYMSTLPRLASLASWLKERFDLIKNMSSSLVPRYFTLVVMLAYHALKYRVISNQKFLLSSISFALTV
jgi:glycogen debranching enzyme